MDLGVVELFEFGFMVNHPTATGNSATNFKEFEPRLIKSLKLDKLRAFLFI